MIIDEENYSEFERFLFSGMLDSNTHKIEILKMKGENVTPKRQNVTADLTTTKKLTSQKAKHK